MCIVLFHIRKKDNGRIGEILVAPLLLKLSKIPSSSISSCMLLLTIALNVIKEGVCVNIRWWMGYAFIVSSHCSIVDLNFARSSRQGTHWTVIASQLLLLAQWFWSSFILVWKYLSIKNPLRLTLLLTLTFLCFRISLKSGSSMLHGGFRMLLWNLLSG